MKNTWFSIENLWIFYDFLREPDLQEVAGGRMNMNYELF